MIWGSFFAGAVAMLFVLLVLMWLIPERNRKENELFRRDQKSDMLILHRFWEQANNLAQERNKLLRENVANQRMNLTPKNRRKLP